jgi:threonine/homoserine/homoserine lactone efflux protein
LRGASGCRATRTTVDSLSILPFLIQGIGYGFSAAVQPGPFQTYLISRSLLNGWRRTLIAAFAPLISDGLIILTVLFILTRVPAPFRLGLQLAGGVFILYLAWGAFRSWRRFDVSAPPAAAADAGAQSLLRAALMNFFNPNPWIFWSLVTGPILIRAWGEAAGKGIAFLTGFYGAMIGCLALIIILFGAARQLGPRVSRAALGISALALAGFGVYQIVKGITQLEVFYT